MDIVETINNVIVKVNEYKDIIEGIYTKYVSKIDKYINDINNIIDTAIHRSRQWVITELNKIKKKIEDIIDGFEKMIHKIIDDLAEWYNNLINNAKSTFLKAKQAKLGLELPDSMLESLANAIPHPDITELIPIPKLNVSIPDISGLIK